MTYPFPIIDAGSANICYQQTLPYVTPVHFGHTLRAMTDFNAVIMFIIVHNDAVMRMMARTSATSFVAFISNISAKLYFVVIVLKAV